MSLLKTLKMSAALAEEYDRQKRERAERERLQRRLSVEERTRLINEAAAKRQAEIEARDAAMTAAIEAGKQKQRDAAQRAEAQWLSERKRLQGRVAHAQTAHARLSGPELDLSSLDSALTAASTAALVLGARHLVETAERDLQRHEAARPRL
jgi:hypothetical protein